MKKLLFIILLAIVAFLFIAPKFAGENFHTRLQASIQEISAQSPYKIDMVASDKGWFTSSYMLSITLSMTDSFSSAGPFNSMEDVVLSVPIQAQHGPLLFASEFNWGWIDFTARLLKPEQLFGMKISAQEDFIVALKGLVTFSNTVEILTEVANFSVRDPNDELAISIDEYQSKGVYSDQLTLSESITPAAMTMEFKNLNMMFRMQGIMGDFRANTNLVHMFKNSFYENEIQFSFDVLEITENAKNTQFAMRKAVISGSTHLDEIAGTASMDTRLISDSLLVKAYQIEDVVLEFSVNNLLIQLFKSLEELNRLAIESPEEVSEKLNALMQNELLSQLQTSPEFVIDSLNFSVAEGEFKANMQSSIQEVHALPLSMDDSAFWMQHAEITFNAAVDRSAALQMIKWFILEQNKADAKDPKSLPSDEQALQVLDSLKAQGLLSEEEQRYQLNFNMRQGIMELNGQTLPQ